LLRYGDKTDIAFLAAGIAAGLLTGLLSVKVGSVAVDARRRRRRPARGNWYAVGYGHAGRPPEASPRLRSKP